MIEVDVFWSFAMGACFAACAGRRLAEAPDAVLNKYFVYTVLFLACVFAPSGAWLLHDFPGWESMYYFASGAEIPGWLVALFGSTNTLLGILGFLASATLIARLDTKDKPMRGTLAGHSLWLTSNAIMFGILGFGYRRFLYPGSGADWRQGKTFPLIDFFSSKVFFTLLAMGVPIIPGILVPCYKWLADNQYTREEKASILRRLNVTFAVDTLAGVAGYLAFIHGYCTDEQRDYFKDGWASYYAPLVGFLAASGALYAIATLPQHTFPVAERKRKAM